MTGTVVLCRSSTTSYCSYRFTYDTAVYVVSYTHMRFAKTTFIIKSICVTLSQVAVHNYKVCSE